MSQLEENLAFQIKALGLPEPLKEYRFHSSRRWRFDLAWPDLKIACEVDGGSWVNGRHNRAGGFGKDCEKASEAAIAGWRVLHVTGDHIQRGDAIKWIERAINGAEAAIARDTSLPALLKARNGGQPRGVASSTRRAAWEARFKGYVALPETPPDRS